MLTSEQNELLTRVGPGTPMGETMRRYWLPALLSWELPQPDCAPVRLRLLGEDLVAFRATDGRIGVLEEFCAHRGASLWLGRNEENGLRCVFHGWKYDATGQCVDQMNEPVQFASKIRVRSYPVVEAGGALWVYMGPKEHQPPPPNFEWTTVPEQCLSLSKVVQECNWLQALEGGIDTSHFTILHRRFRKDAGYGGVDVDSPGVQGRAPTLEVEVTDYGYRYFGIRPLGEDRLYVRGYHFVMPFTQIRPPGPNRNEAHGHHWVPIDDHNCLVWNWYYAYDGQPPAADDGSNAIDSTGNVLGKDVDVENGFRSRHGRGDNWGIDRDVQRTLTFTGIPGINTQDRAVQESMGQIVDRSREHLGPADKAIIAARKLLEDAARTVADGGSPLGVAPSYYELRSAEGIFPVDADWHDGLLPRMYPESLRVPSP